MRAIGPGEGLKVFTTAWALARQGACVDQLQEIARWSDAAGCDGMLVLSDQEQLDPWLVAQVITGATERLCPVVTVQPGQLHPFTAAKKIASFAHLYGRPLHLNLVAGGIGTELAAFSDPIPHHERYARVVEYATLVLKLLQSAEPVTFIGRYYQVHNVAVTPALAAALQPIVLVSGFSAAGSEAARELCGTAIEYARPASDYPTGWTAAGTTGIRIGIIARSADEDAWSIALQRYPEDRRELPHQAAIRARRSRLQHRPVPADTGEERHLTPYWLGPFNTFKATCPYLVGSYERVAEEVARYVALGFRAFVLDEPTSAVEMRHVPMVFERAVARALAA
ncbi:MAG TPA: LLM class flavin-dependent oxidoreductase [Steroidobacteraceae bacterium]|nr:LLM class flavin-dependent oxidoreductase [Steroidobacteraceae bacterium]